MIAVKFMAFLPPAIFQQFKQATIQGLAFMCCVWGQAKYYRIVVPCKLQ